MKKNYVKPTIEVELAEAGELMTGSGDAAYDLGGGKTGSSNSESGGISEATDADEWDMGAKGGSFTCWEDEGDWAL